jgi:hypothetical protein
MSQFTQGNQRRFLTSAPKRAAKWTANLGAALILVASARSWDFQSFFQAGERKVNRNVEIHSDQVELVDVQPGAERCPDQKKATTIRLKVKSEKAVDIKIFCHISGSTWVGKDFLNKRRGDEISTYLCDSHPKVKVYSHEAGSSETWPKP